jgi:hypothetical protein
MIKKASTIADIVALIVADSSIGFATKQELVARVQQLSDADASTLRNLLYRAGGAGVGALVAHAFGAGLIGKLVGAGVGYFGGAMLSRSQPSGVDVLGRPYLF